MMWINRGQQTARAERGDTIVEVLIALSVIGLTLAASFGLANNAANTGRAAQERTEALKIAESQLEWTKDYLKAGGDPVVLAATSFCFDDMGARQDATNAVCATSDGEGGTGIFAVENDEISTGTYQFFVRWERINTGGEPGVVDLYYRTGAL